MSASNVAVPNFRVTMNGTVMQGVESVSVSPPLAFQVGTFRIKKAFVAKDQFPLSWFASTAQKTMLVVIELTVDGKTYPYSMTGNVDSNSIDMNENAVSIAGRDLGALLLDQRSFTTYRNRTASEIAAALASEHNLQISATPTKTIVGRYYDTDHDQIQTVNGSNASNEWDLLCKIGSKAGVIPYVSGNTLYFNPPPTTPQTVVANYYRDSSGQPHANVESMKLERHLTVARDVQVTVFSWHSRKKAPNSATVRTKTKDAASNGTDIVAKYYIQKPNLTTPQCLAQAQYYAQEISQHERTVAVKFPSLQFFPPQALLQVAQTGTDYDQNYNPQSIVYTVAAKGGASTSVSAKFSSPLFLYDEQSGATIGEQA